MSFSKAEQLMELASMVAGHRTGITLDDVTERFSCSYRTAQRMIVALETSFPDVVSRTDEEGRKRWRLEGGHLRDLMNLTERLIPAVARAAIGGTKVMWGEVEIDLAKWSRYSLREAICVFWPDEATRPNIADFSDARATAVVVERWNAMNPGASPVSLPIVEATPAGEPGSRAVARCRLLKSLSISEARSTRRSEEHTSELQSH